MDSYSYISLAVTKEKRKGTIHSSHPQWSAGRLPFNLPPEYAPVFYRRYVDDCFILFKNPSYADMFLNLLNSKHPRMKFTVEKNQTVSFPSWMCLFTEKMIDLKLPFTESPNSQVLEPVFFSAVFPSRWNFPPSLRPFSGHIISVLLMHPST